MPAAGETLKPFEVSRSNPAVHAPLHWHTQTRLVSLTLPLMFPSPSGPKDLLSDRCILSCPSMDLVTCLLDFRLNFASNRSIVPRLAASLAACAQLSALGTQLVFFSCLKLLHLWMKRVFMLCLGAVLCSRWTQDVGSAETQEAADHRVRSVHQHKPAAG